MEANFLFFIYAFPAMDGCCGVKEREKGKYLEMILRGEAPSRKELEEMFPAAFIRMEDRYGDNYWTVKNIEDYWRVEHNRIIDTGEAGYEDATPEQKATCKTGSWKIKDIGDGKIIKLENRLATKVSGYNFRGLELKDGGYVATHKNWISKKDTLKEFKKYG